MRGLNALKKGGHRHDNRHRDHREPHAQQHHVALILGGLGEVDEQASDGEQREKDFHTAE